MGPAAKDPCAHRIGLAASVALALGLAGAPERALAQGQAGLERQAARDFNIEAGPIEAAVIQFTQQAGVQLVLDPAVGRGAVVKAVRGRMSPDQALAQLLAGLDLSWRDLGQGVITLVRTQAQVRVIGAVQVEGRREGDPFGAGAGDNGGSDPTATEGTGSLMARAVTIASRGAPTALVETPQSVSVMTRERLDQLKAVDLSDALSAMPGLAVVKGSTGRTSAQSRGFDIKSIAIDGGAARTPADVTDYDPFEGLNLAAYDSVQVLRGSYGLLGGASDPGGVINLVRKRPLDHAQGLALAERGAWKNRHFQVDVTGPIVGDPNLRGRLVVDYQVRRFFYQTARRANAMVYGVLEGDLGDDTVWRAGGSFTRRIGHGENKFGLPRASDGSDLRLPRWLNLAPLWSMTDLKQPEAFAALEHRFGAHWGLSANAAYLRKTPSLLLSSVESVIAQGGAGPGIEVAAFDSQVVQTQLTSDVTVNGTYWMLGRPQAIAFGVDSNVAKADGRTRSQLLQRAFNLATFTPADLGVDAPSFLGGSDGVTLTRRRQLGAFASTKIDLLDRLTLAAGGRLASYDYRVRSAGVGLDGAASRSAVDRRYAAVFTPSASLSYALRDRLNLYVSYAEIFGSNIDSVMVSGVPIDPSTGATWELGLKGAARSNRLSYTVALYDTRQSNVAVATPAVTNPAVSGCCYVGDGRRTSRGLDAELVGEVGEGWQVQLSYNYNHNQQNMAYAREVLGAGPVSAQQPKHAIRLWTSFAPPSGRLRKWTLGGGLRYESARGARGLICVAPSVGAEQCAGVRKPATFRQPGYAVADLRAAYQLDRHLEAAVQVTNIADLRYYATVGQTTQGSFYGEPRAVTVSLRARY